MVLTKPEYISDQRILWDTSFWTKFLAVRGVKNAVKFEPPRRSDTSKGGDWRPLF